MIKKIILAGMIGVSVLLIQVSVLSAAASKNAAKTLTVVGFVGTAEVKTTKNKWKTLNIDDKVTEKNEIRILKKYDYLELALEDGVYRVTGKTTLKVADLFKKINSDKKRTLNTTEDYKVATTTAPAAVLGNTSAPGKNSSRPVILPPELSFVVTGFYKGACTYRIGNKSWQPIGYGIRLPREAELKITDKDGTVQLKFFDKSFTNITGPADIMLTDVLAAKKKSM